MRLRHWVELVLLSALVGVWVYRLLGKQRFITRRIPGFKWVQVMVSARWEWGHWWSVRGIARTHAFGPLRVCTMRTDCLDRARKPGGEFYREDAP